MKYLIDTDILIEFLNGNPQIVSRVEPLTSDGLAISVISYLEALQGMLRLDDIEGSISDFSRAVGYIAFIEVTVPVARACAKIRYDLARAKRRFRNRSLDLIIAATAIEYNLTLVTRNRDDYHDIPGLVMVNI